MSLSALSDLKFTTNTHQRLEALIKASQVQINPHYIAGQYAWCFDSPLSQSQHPLKYLLMGRYKKLKPYDIVRMEQQLVYEQQDFLHPHQQRSNYFNYTTMRDLSSDITQQLIVMRKLLGTKFKRGTVTEDDQIPKLNHHFYCYKYHYRAYGHICYNSKLDKYVFAIRELDPFRVDDEGYESWTHTHYHTLFKHNADYRATLIKYLMNALKHAGIKYIDFGHWFGSPSFGKHKKYRVETKDKTGHLTFDFPLSAFHIY